MRRLINRESQTGGHTEVSQRRDDLVGYILARLGNVRPTPRGWTARCPAHDDHSPSLSLRVGEQAILIKCFAGCPVKDICRALGIEMRDLFYDTSKPRRRQSGAIKLPQRPHWRATATALEQHAMGLYLPLGVRAGGGTGPQYIELEPA